MFDDINDLYQQVILDHCKKPRNFHELPQCTCSAQGHNPLCGDQLKLFLNLDGDTIKITHYMYFDEDAGFGPISEHIFPRPGRRFMRS